MQGTDQDIVILIARKDIVVVRGQTKDRAIEFMQRMKLVRVRALSLDIPAERCWLTAIRTIRFFSKTPDVQ